MSNVATSRLTPQNDDWRIALWITLAALLALGIGFFAAMSYDASQQESTPLRLVEFRKLDVQSNGGLVVLSFALEVAADEAAQLDRHKASLHDSFRNALAQISLDALYSRQGKEELGATIQAVANTALGDEIVTGVYFGDFKIYSR